MKSAGKVAVIMCLMVNPAHSEIKYMVNHKIISPSSSGIVKAEKGRNKRAIAKYCLGSKMIESSIADMEKHTKFPLQNNVYPAAKFVGGFLKIRSIGRGLGFYPQGYTLIWQNISMDGDKSFSKTERDNVVALWKYTQSWVQIQCNG